MNSPTTIETRVRWVEARLNQIESDLANAKQKLGLVYQDNTMDQKPEQGAGGQARYAVVTTLITAATAGTLGKGAGKLQLVTYADGTDVGTYADSGAAPVIIYNGGVTTIAVGRLIIVTLLANRYNVIVDFC